jgi:hypothetical protein
MTAAKSAICDLNGTITRKLSHTTAGILNARLLITEKVGVNREI